MAVLSNEEILQAIAQKPVMDIVKLIEAMEKEFNVSAAAAAVAMPMAAAAGAAAAEEKTHFNVKMTAIGENKVNVIKAVRSITGLGLKEAKDLVESAPCVVKEGVSKEDSEKFKKELEEAGAKVELA